MAARGSTCRGSGGRDGSSLALAVPARQLADAPLTVRVTGVPVGHVVDLDVRARWWSGEVLTARARFRSADGTVDVSRDAPIQGYDGVDADGLLHALVVDATDPTATPGSPGADGGEEAELGADRVDLRARIDTGAGRGVRATTWREAMTASVRRDDRLLRGVAVTLLSDTRRVHHGPVVIAVAPAGRRGALRSAALLASHGYRVALVCPTLARDGLLTLPGGLVDAARAVWPPGDAPGTWGPPGDAPGTDGSLLLVLDVVADRRSVPATLAWHAVLEQLRGLRVAASPP